MEKRNTAHEQDSDNKETMLSELNDDEGSNKTSCSENQMQQLNPIVLVVSCEQFKHTHVTDDVDHATAGGAYEHTNGQIYKVERK